MEVLHEDRSDPDEEQQNDDGEHQRILALPLFPLLFVSGLILLEHPSRPDAVPVEGMPLRGFLLPEHLRFSILFVSGHRFSPPLLLRGTSEIAKSIAEARKPVNYTMIRADSTAG